MTEFRVNKSSDIEAGEAGDGRSDVPEDVAMEMVTSATSIAAVIAGATRFGPMERN
jgi:hypothetical protein